MVHLSHQNRTPKSGPPDQFLLKNGPPDKFWQQKLVHPGLILAAKMPPPLAKNSSPTDARPDRIWHDLLAKTVPHVKIIVLK